MPITTTPRVLRVGSRDSKLALIQTELVVAALQKAHPTLSIEIQTMKTIGDKIQDVALSKFGDKGLFTKELETALAAGLIDLVVHSLKDMPTTLPPNMALAAVTEREDARDALIMAPRHTHTSLDDLPPGSVVGTGSVRRVAQLRRLYPHLRFMDIRGNLNTRLAKLDAEDSPFDALILAVAGMTRLGMHHRITQPIDNVLHAVGQGALGIEIRADDDLTRVIAQGLDHQPSRLACAAERELMRVLEGGCSVPIGAVAHWDEPTKRLSLNAIVASPDGAQAVEASSQITTDGDEDAQARALGAQVAAMMRERGAAQILAAIERA
ncbi:porphobilinogen deaminase [Coemansia sp. 'formosensis']|nr:porphobilinogen deaminase [Coemansia sp. 'formosensis']